MRSAGATPYPLLSGGAAVRLLLAAWLVCALLGAGPAWAGIIFTPSISAGVGYDDNVRQQRNPHGDGFVTVRPGASLEMGKPTNQLQISGSAQFDKYYRLSNYDGFQSGDLSARWRFLPSPRWAFELYDSLSSSYDFLEFNEAGALTRTQAATGRHDRNTTGARMTHLLGPGGSQITAGYAYTVVRNENAQLEDQVTHHADLGLGYRLAPHWRTNFSVSGDRDDYERSADVERGSAEARLAYLFNPHDEVWAGVVLGGSRTLSPNPSLQQARDYTTYSPRVGFKKGFSPQLDVEGYVGTTYVSGDDASNSASGEFAPVGNLQVTYRQKTWLFRIYALAAMDESQSLGQNTGLVDRKQVSANFDWRPALHWRYSLGADWVRDDYKQNALLAGTFGQGYTEYWRVYSLLSYQLAQHWSVTLDYRYLIRYSESDQDNLEQNRVVLTLDYALPMRW